MSPRQERTGKERTNLDTLEGAESRGPVITVPGVSVPLAPGHEVEGQRAGVGGPDGLLEGQHVGQDIVEDVGRAEAGTLRLILDDDDIPVSVPDGVKSPARHVARQGLPSGGNHGSAGRFPCGKMLWS